ncbi:Hypothetical protein, putative [Bodo saltans]|uniref:C2 domain-containing protein n=1 Tax=Bodo saltans TaxID=75058 RepID=A0A0S4ITF4_BODSA|nr:Hypothetical protein, putative [Bodo saltans]|eukprot:CUF45058.1 Hypothetical protein, putative [Bodo saltans]
MSSAATVDILVDAPLMGILPQRITVDLSSVVAASLEDPSGDSWLRVLLAQIEPALVDADGREVLLPADATSVLLSEPQQPGVFSPIESSEKLTQLARLRIAPKSTPGDVSGRGKPRAPDLSAVFSMLGNESSAFDPNAPVIGHLYITIVRCEGLLNVDTLKTSSPYVAAYGQGRKEVFRTETVEGNLSPVYYDGTNADVASFTLPVNSFSGHARFRVMSRQYMDAFMGEATVEVVELVGSAGDELTFELQPRRNEQDPDIAGAQSLGTITIRCIANFTTDDNNNNAEAQQPQEEEDQLPVEEEEQQQDDAAAAAASDSPVPSADDIATPPNAEDPPLFQSSSPPVSPNGSLPPQPPIPVNQNKSLGETETTSVMLDVVKLVVADAVASIPLSVAAEYELSLRKLDVMRGGVMEDRGWSSRDIPDDTISRAFFRAMLDGYQIGIGHSRRATISVNSTNSSASSNRHQGGNNDHEEEVQELRDHIEELTLEIDALQKRLNKCLNDLESTRDELAESQQNLRLNPASIAVAYPPASDVLSGLQSPNSMQGNRAPPCTPATQHAGGQQLTPTQLPLAMVTTPPPNKRHQRHLDANQHNGGEDDATNIALPPTTSSENDVVENNNNAEVSPRAVIDEGGALEDDTASPASIDAMVDYTMVVCFYNSFDYVTKTTRKKGRAVSLSSSKGETRFQMLQRTVAATFREGLSISYLDVEGKRHVITTDGQLTSLLLKLKASGYRPVFQCFHPEEELEASARVDIGSSPKKMFVMRNPTPPEAPSSALSTLVTSPSRQSSRPSSAATSQIGSRTNVAVAEAESQWLPTCIPMFSSRGGAEASARVDIGSSPKKMFVMRNPTPPEAPSSALLTLVTSPSRQSSRPSSAATSQIGSRTVSAMSVRSSATSMPFDYIAGSALDDNTIAREFEIVSGGGDTVSKETVLAYLEARYDSIGDAGRFKRLLDSLFRRKSTLGVNEFAIVLLRLSQS